MKSPAQSNIPDEILDLITKHSTQEVHPGVDALAEAARTAHGDAVHAVLFYGSMLRSGNVYDGLADLYLLVDDYRTAFNGRILPFFNKILPPNVFYLEIPFQGKVIRAKYAVLTLADFCEGVEGWFHSYVWGRFAQKSGLIYARNEQVETRVREALATAAMTFLARTLPQMGPSFTARDLWSKGLSLSYRSELRTEQADASVRLFDADPEYYQELTHAILANSKLNVESELCDPTYQYNLNVEDLIKRKSRTEWRTRMVQGKILSVLRLSKAFFTFKGGIDYILWKIERHSKVRVEVSPKLKRVPPLAVLVVFWRLYRQGGFR